MRYRCQCLKYLCVFLGRIALSWKTMLTLEYVVVGIPSSVADEAALALLC